MSHEISGRHLIDGQWRATSGADTFQSSDPATGETLPPAFPEASERDVDDALRAASTAFEVFLDLPPRWTADLLDAIADRIMDLGDALLDRAGRETALPKPRLVGERARTCNQLKMFAALVREGSWVDAVIDRADPNRAPMPKPDVRRVLRPRGPVVVFGASNFPFAFGTAGGDTASALAAGNPVVVKGHPSHPGTSELFAAAVLDALRACKLPTGLFTLLQGKRHELSAMLVRHASTEAVGFTGSQRAGRALFDLAASRPRPIPVYAEMGSLNPVVLLPGALSERGETIAKDLAGSVLLGGGQFCTKPGVIFAIGERASQFVDLLSEQIKSAAPVTMLNSNLRENFSSRAGTAAKTSGVQTLVEAKPSGAASMSPGLMRTTSDVWAKESELHEEVFGPAALVVECKSVDEACDAVRHVGGSLTGTVHVGANDPQASVAHVVRTLEQHAGRVIVNGYPTGVEVCHAIVHGGPYPATTDAGTTSVGTAAIRRFVRMTAYQDTPGALLPPALQDANPLGIERTIDGQRTREAVTRSWA